MSLMLFILVLIASFFIVRCGAVAFHLTGMEWSQAKFQSLSCFSGTGFTTRESELIVGDKRRRQIASVLIVLGNAGLVTLIAAAASSLNPENTILYWLSQSYLPFLPVWSIRWVNLAIVALAFWVSYKVFVNPKFTHSLTDYLRRKILKKSFFKTVSFEELLLLSGDYGISQFQVPPAHALIGKTLAQSELRQRDIILLAILRGDQTLPNPSAQTNIQQDDGLIMFGKLESIRAMVPD